MLEYIQKSSLTNVYFGPQGFQLFSLEVEQKKAQQKFATDPSWDNDWFIVGIDTELGDPYLIKKSSDDAIVYTGIFDGNNWSLIPVAVSIHAFIECLILITNISTQTSEVYVPDDSTIVNSDTLKNLEQQLIYTSKCEEFWKQFFVCYLDWLEE